MKRQRRNLSFQQNDSVCMICQCGGELILCDRCPSSFHLACIHLQEVPKGKWFCPACLCGLCKERDSSDKVLYTSVCNQCNHRYHLDCLAKMGLQFPRHTPSQSFCTQNCYKLCVYLHEQLGISYSTNVDGLSWTMIKSESNDCSFADVTRRDTSNLLSAASELMRKCFCPLDEPLTKRNLLDDIIHNAASDIRRLDFRGFYVVVLQNGEELVSAALVRIHGHTVAEMPLIATAFQYRRKGMCRLLFQELEKMLVHIGVKRLVLPSVSELLGTWKASFGFSKMSHQERLEILGYSFLVFQGTVLLQKVLSESVIKKERRGLDGDLIETDTSSPKTSSTDDDDDFQVEPRKIRKRLVFE